MEAGRLLRAPLLTVAAGALAAIVLGLMLWRAAGGGGEGVSGTDPGPVHVHALGVDPADDALFIATHTGLYRVPEGEEKARRVGDRFQDTMGFTVVGPRRFLGSGHPDLRDDLPPLLGLIESTDSGGSWEPISLLGEADFHVLRVAGERVYGYDATGDRLLVNADRGRTWTELAKPGALVDLAVDPGNGRRLAATTNDGVFQSPDGGESWQRLGDTVGLLAWPDREHLYLVAGKGQLLVSSDGGRLLRQLGEIGGEPAALLARDARELYVALHDGTIKRSGDGGRTWAIRSAP